MKTRVKTFTNMFLSLTFCLGLASCNKDDFYQKEFLDNPFQDPTTKEPVDNGGHDGDLPGTDGGTQGGVDSGVGGGTTGGTTGTSPSEPSDPDDGSSTGGSTGGTNPTEPTDPDDGSSTGGSTGGTNPTEPTDPVDPIEPTDPVNPTEPTDPGDGTSYVDCNQGHGNDADGVDESNPTIGTDPRCKREKFTQTSSVSKKLDIVWVIDNSGSMKDEQDALGANFSAFIQDFITRDIDFKMAITTTDTSSSYEKGRMVTGSAEKLNSVAAQNNPVKFMEDFKKLVQVGTSGSGYEKGLEAADEFMKRYSSSFLRKDAYLAVVILSDEEDQSAKSVATYTNQLKKLKDEEGLVKVYSIVDVGLTNTQGYGVSTGYKRYADASKNTAGIVADIREDFHKSLSDMGGTIINLLDSFALANDPVSGTLKVYVDGVETTHYTFDEASRSIKFNAEHIPSVGAEITVTYVKQ